MPSEKPVNPNLNPVEAEVVNDIFHKRGVESASKEKENLLQEAKKPSEIEKRLKNAKALLANMLRGKTASKKNDTLHSFFIGFDNMAVTLELSLLPPEIVRKEMDKIVLSVPGMGTNEQGYIISNPDLIIENFGPSAISDKILKILADNSDKIYTYPNFAKELGCSQSTIGHHVNGLIREGKVSPIYEPARYGPQLVGVRFKATEEN